MLKFIEGASGELRESFQIGRVSVYEHRPLLMCVGGNRGNFVFGCIHMHGMCACIQVCKGEAERKFRESVKILS